MIIPYRTRAVLSLALSCFVALGTLSAQSQSLRFGQRPGARVVFLPFAGDSAASSHVVSLWRDRSAARFRMTDLWIVSDDDMMAGLERSHLSRAAVWRLANEGTLARAFAADVIAQGSVWQDSGGWRFLGRVFAPGVEGLMDSLPEVEGADLQQLADNVDEMLHPVFRAMHFATRCVRALDEGGTIVAEKAMADALASWPRSVPARVCRLRQLSNSVAARDSIVALAAEILAIQRNNAAALRAVSGTSARRR